MNTVQHPTSTPAAPPRPASFLAPEAARRPGILALEGGTIHAGSLRGAARGAEGDLVFTTSASGWGEILTDPSYAGQIVVLTHPMVGSYRIAADELESATVHARALVVSRLVSPPPGPGVALEELLVEAGIPALAGVDTRALTLELRRGTRRRAVVRDATTPAAEAVAAARASAPWEAVDHVAAVASREPFVVPADGARRGRAVLLDYGVKRSLLRSLTERGLEVVGLPPDASTNDVLARAPDLVVLSPGPGDPSRMAFQIATVRELARLAAAGGPPLLGVCLGHQLLGLAAGAATRRLPVGHHGGNHAVIELEGGRVDIGAHNHEIEVVDGPALGAAGYRVSHRDLNDGTLEGLVHASGRIASVQFHPEGAPGPTDAARIFDGALRGALASVAA
ncbi:MAG TPA: carbamoyl phosphate synthase small subunit [Candidatus Limnocylindria bacterium]|nr:carbamoyl phosphate synthase small subunit [Candidatus Limnocylindria bacterium]